MHNDTKSDKSMENESRIENEYQQFLTVAKFLNEKLGIIPVLFGSLGLEKITGFDFNVQDIDILVPKNYIFDDWNKLEKLMSENGYQLIDLHEHEFEKDGQKVAFSFEEDLKDFADVDYKNLKKIEKQNVYYKVLNLEDFLKVYKKSSMDSYRKNKNNAKDQDKILLIEKILIQKNK